MKPISIIIPVYNEEKNILPLYARIIRFVPNNYEIIFINDGSSDGTQEVIDSIKNKKVDCINFRNNLGKSAALTAGFHRAKHQTIVTMDGDLQNDPKDILKLIKQLKDYAVVCGWRIRRKDPLIKKRLPSWIFNFMIRALFKLKIHDCSCTLRVYRKNVIKNFVLEKGQHRLLPIILSKRGYKITEMDVHHSPRRFGKAKFDSPLRFFKTLIDIVRLKFK